MVDVILSEDEIDEIVWALDIAIASPIVSGLFCEHMERIKNMLIAEKEMAE